MKDVEPKPFAGRLKLLSIKFTLKKLREPKILKTYRIMAFLKAFMAEEITLEKFLIVAKVQEM